jgi:hypothetical protein
MNISHALSISDAVIDFDRQINTVAVVCPRGHYCIDGDKQSCPEGTFVNTFGLTTCSGCAGTVRDGECGTCQEGYYCGAGSTGDKAVDCAPADTLTPEKYYCPNKGGRVEYPRLPALPSGPGLVLPIIEEGGWGEGDNCLSKLDQMDASSVRGAVATAGSHWMGTAVAVADVNGDGFEDVLRYDSTGRVTLTFQDTNYAGTTTVIVDTLAATDSTNSTYNDAKYLGNRRFALGAPGYDGNRGAVYILDLNADGTKAALATLDGTQLPDRTLETDDAFGSCVVPIGDLNEDGNGPDLLVCAPGRTNQGAVVVLYMGADGTSVTSMV